MFEIIFLQAIVLQFFLLLISDPGGWSGTNGCVRFMLRETFDCILVGGGEFSLSLSLSDQQGCLRWYVLGCLRAACLLITRFVFLSCLLCFPSRSAGKESACNGGDLGLIAGLERSTGEWNGYPLQYSGLENSMDCVAHGVTKSQTWVTFTCYLSEVSNIRCCQQLCDVRSWIQV